MKTFIDKIQKNPWTAVIGAVIIGAAIMFISSAISKPITNIIDKHIGLDFYTRNAIFKFLVLLLTIAVILVVNKGNLTNYGFRKATNINYFKFTLRVTGIILAAQIIGAVLFMGILNHIFPTGNSTGFPETKSLLERILTVWIWSSLCEEVLVRGFVQSFIQHLKHLKLFRLSLPVIISGLFFGTIHLSLFKAGMGLWFVLFIVFNTTIIGLTAAYYREKTDSLIPAFWAHFIANVVGSLPLLIKLLIS